MLCIYTGSFIANNLRMEIKHKVVSRDRRPKPANHDNMDRWLLTYADMITLLTALFIMLYAMSAVNMARFEQMAISVRHGFNTSWQKGDSSILNHQGNNIKQSTPAVPQQDQKPIKDIDKKTDTERTALTNSSSELINFLKQNKLEGRILVNQTERGIQVTMLTDSSLFEKGKADIEPDYFHVLNEIAHIVNAKEIADNPIRVEGYTDDLPIHTGKFRNNWDLSAVRAVSILMYLQDHNVIPSRMTAVAYGEHAPRKPNTSEDNRKVNRRVDIVILSKHSS